MLKGPFKCKEANKARMMEEMSDGAAAIKHGKDKKIKNSVTTEKETRRRVSL